MFKTVLSGYGFETHGAEDARSAVELLTQRPFDVIISDINMPGLSGLELLRSVRARDRDVPVILMTGKPSAESSVEALERGAFRYFIKPIMPAVLREAVECAIQAHDIARSQNPSTSNLASGSTGAGERRFERALAAIWIAYQPIVSCPERTVFGYEALVRTDEPGFEFPGVLVEAATRLGRLAELGAMARSRAAVRPPGSSKLLVKVAPSELSDADLHDPASKLATIADQVMLELTERPELERVTDLSSRVATLREIGFAIAIDALSGGYADLETLERVRPDAAKLDAALVHDIHCRSAKQRSVRAMSRLCSDQGIAIIAPGVDAPADRRALLDLGVELLQGDLFAKPARRFPAVPDWV
jgi:EAL domain-containing protein (putative c-di-GMP-specific phosphodiesterase class I)